MIESSNKKFRNTHTKSLKGGEFETVAVNDKHTDFAHIQPVIAKPIEIVVYNNSFDKALRAFKALVQKERILSLYKEKQTYEKPSDKKRRKRNEMRRKMLEMNNKSNYKNRDNSKFE
jgi:small subunit ribosomal protein S21